MNDKLMRVYIVEDEPEIREALEDITAGEGFEVEGFYTAEHCLERLEAESCDILVTDLKLPGIDGVELARRIHQERGSISIIFITAYGNLTSALKALDYGAEDYIIKPFNVDSIRHSLDKVSRKRLLEAENEQYRKELQNELDRRQTAIVEIGQQLEETFFKTVQLLGNAQESRERFLHGRTERITIYTLRTAEMLNWSKDKRIQLAITAPVSDVGKISISDTILNKKEELTKAEQEELHAHVLYGEQIIRSLPHFQDVGAIIRYHHERINGSGYPEGLTGDDIPEQSLLIGLCDTFDAMTHNRPWRAAYSVDETLSYLKNQAGVTFPVELVDAFEEAFHKFDFASIINQKPIEQFFKITFPLLEALNI